jgi:hypothetical protein
MLLGGFLIFWIDKVSNFLGFGIRRNTRIVYRLLEGKVRYHRYGF